MIWYLVTMPGILLVSGILFFLLKPKRINWIYGYRTRASSRSQETWNYTNKLCGKLLCAAGILVLAVYFVIYLGIEALHPYWDWIVVVSLMVSLGTIILIVQRRLNANFDKSGQRK